MEVAAPAALSERISAVIRIDPAAPAIEFAGRQYSWGDLATTVDAIAAEVTPGLPVGVILRNTPVHVGALLGVLAAGGCVVTINPHRGVARTRDDIAELALAVIVGTTDDLAELAPGVRRTIAVADLGTVPVVTEHPVAAGAAALRAGVAVLMLTSGTTGPPKRVELTYAMLERTFQGAKHYERDRSGELRLRRGVAVVNSPLVHLGGVFRVLQCVVDGRGFVLLPKFEVAAWVDAVRRHRPQAASLVPAALRMVLEVDVDPADLASIKAVVCGTAPLGADEADAFRERFGIPVLTNYAATEFGGGVAGWTLPLHQEWWAVKRGSAGRAQPGCQLRVVGDDGTELPTDEVGVLEVQAAQLDSDEWVRTTDLARIDADGFLWIVGRADQAIIRGGFKVLPDDVRRALEAHPAVREASVVGLADARLGAVPAAAVEPAAGAHVDTDELRAHAERVLAPYEVPVVIRVIDALPRTESGKPDLVAVRAVLEERVEEG